MGRKLLLIGGGGHCHSVLDSVISLGLYDDFGIVDNVDCSYFGISVVGTDDDIPDLVKNGWTDAFITVGSVGNTSIRRKLYEMVKLNNMIIPKIIDSTAVIAKDAHIDEGVYIGKKAIVNSGTSIGTCSIINSGVIIDHDCTVGEFVHVSPGCTVCGQVTIGDDSHIGAGSVIRQQIAVGEKSMVGLGSVVVKDVPDSCKAYGNPCRRVE